ncbi:MAG: AzlC family ABC transporter permease [Coriobacteriia bacterium]|nr:AzlC family ABC transporter permease [Actinomycetota bacterium]MDZ4167270.1 AzlC family ABC transporter permease [Coriobacteriia bacterium]
MPTTESKQAPCPPRRARFARGLRLGLPILLGYMPVGAAFGIVARDLGFTPLQAVTCSATALAGAGQFIGLALMKSGATALTVVAATTVVNLRYVLFGAAMSPHVSRVPLGGQAILAFTLTDETFAVNIDDNRRGSADAFSMAGVGAIAWVGWVAGTALGALTAGLIGDPSAWGVQFAMPAMFSALLVAQAEDRRHVVIGAVAAALAILLMLTLPADWYVLVTPVLAATLAAVVYR